MELKKKLSAKTIVGKVKPLLPKNDKGEIINESPVALMRVYGICNGIKSGVSTFGEWIAFTGNFKAIRLSDGEVFAGGQLFVPDVVTELLGPVVRAAQGADVEFAFDIGAQGTETEVGYEYMVNPLMKIEESAPLLALEARLNLAALPAPTSAPAPAPEAAKGKGKK
jgi:hypothetical protein